MITHFQVRETKGKDYFRTAWIFSFTLKSDVISGIYHQDGSIQWVKDPGDNKLEASKELHRLMVFHVFQ